MTLTIVPETAPLTFGDGGVIKIAGTRVTLDTLIAAFHEGATAEEIVQQYPSLRLADVYSVIGYYLRHQIDVNDYLEERRQRSDALRVENEARFKSEGIRERLLARRKHSL
jgi:uncharacterized protein (DUF433 family)